MATIDVDRHILSEIMCYHRDAKELADKFRELWNGIIEVRDKTDALLFQHPQCPHLTQECAFRQQALWTLREQIFEETKEADKVAQEIRSLYMKEEALLMHLVSLIRNADTGQGLESTKEGEEVNEDANS